MIITAEILHHDRLMVITLLCLLIRYPGSRLACIETLGRQKADSDDLQFQVSGSSVHMGAHKFLRQARLIISIVMTLSFRILDALGRGCVSDPIRPGQNCPLSASSQRARRREHGVGIWKPIIYSTGYWSACEFVPVMQRRSMAQI